MPVIISSPIIGASPTHVFKPTYNGVDALGTAFYDKYAPFAIGTRGFAVGSNPVTSGEAQYCRVVTAPIAAGATAGITAGATVAAVAGNTFTNGTGVTLAVGDYAWLVAGAATTP